MPLMTIHCKLKKGTLKWTRIYILCNDLLMYLPLLIEHVGKKGGTIYSDCCLLEAFPPLPFLLPLEDERLELELPERDELLSELPLELLLDEEEDPDLLRERDELKNLEVFLYKSTSSIEIRRIKYNVASVALNTCMYYDHER